MEEAPIGSAQKKTRNRKLHWKTEYLVYCFFVRCNISMTRIAALFGIRRILVHDIVYDWAIMLRDTLAKFFPVPTRSQMLRAYPKVWLRSLVTRTSSCFLMRLRSLPRLRPWSQSMQYYTLHTNITLRSSGLSDVIPCHRDSVGRLYQWRISWSSQWSFQTTVTKILEQIPFGCAVEVDKGFLIENDCALLGIHCIRPMKMLQGQTQQSKEDVALT